VPPTYIQSLTKSCPHHMQDTIITQLQHKFQQWQHQLQHQLQHDQVDVVEVHHGSTKQVVEVRNKWSDSAMDNMQSRC